MSTDPPRWHKGTLMNTTNKAKVAVRIFKWLWHNSDPIFPNHFGGKL